MVIDINVILGILQIIVQILAAYFSYVIYNFNRLNRAWLTVFAALILMAFRRVTALLIELNLVQQFPGAIQFIDRIALPLIISVFLAIGLFTMKKNFETFEVVEKRTKRKIKTFIDGRR